MLSVTPDLARKMMNKYEFDRQELFAKLIKKYQKKLEKTIDDTITYRAKSGENCVLVEQIVSNFTNHFFRSWRWDWWLLHDKIVEMVQEAGFVVTRSSTTTAGLISWGKDGKI